MFVWQRLRLPALLLATVILAGCAGHQAACTPRLTGTMLASTDLQSVMRQVASELCPSACGPGRTDCDDRGMTTAVLVPDFVDINTYRPDSAGLYLGEALRAAISTQCRRQIHQVEFARYFRLSNDGLVALSRNPSDIGRDTYQGLDIVVGTYRLSNGRLSLFARLVDGQTNVIRHMTTRDIIYQCSGDKASVQSIQ